MGVNGVLAGDYEGYLIDNNEIQLPSPTKIY